MVSGQDDIAGDTTMKTYEIKDIMTGQTMTVRARSIENAAKRIMKSCTDAWLEMHDPRGTGGVVSLWKRNQLVTKVSVFQVE